MLKSKTKFVPQFPKPNRWAAKFFTDYNKRNPSSTELFVESLLTKAVQITSARNAKTLSPAHLKQCILAESRFDFLKDLVLTIPDVQTEGEENGMTSMPSTPTAQQHQPLVFRSLSEAGSSSSTTKSKATGTGRPRGRPRKTPAALAPTAQNNQRKWAGRKSDSEETDSGDSEDDDDDENSTDTESLPTGTSPSKNGRDVASATAQQASFQFNAVQPNFYQEIGGQTNSSFQIQINLPPETAPSESDKIGNGQEKEVPPPTTHHANNDDDDYDT
uniref:EOG090X0H1B n=1 Tax=Daphnia dolichocephala TaxID=2282166 RepID=A0A4Y7M1K0_9CRUS|nr:EOG090X0H1B [Daphnia dolichocephala]